MADAIETVTRVAVAVVALVVAVVVGWAVFVRLPGGFAELVGVLLTLGVAVAAVRGASSLTDSLFPGYNTAEVTVEGPISRDPSGIGPTSGGTPADDVVEQIERADEDDAAEALLLELNTPGGEVVPSDDIRSAAMAFDGPTVAYATDLCASGGMWIASGCDELWARDASQVGSIGVLGLRPNVSGFLNDRGIQFEKLTAGEYKDAGQPVTEFSDEDLEYLQGLTDGFYDQFVDRVAEGMDLDPEFVRETEARVYLGEEAVETGLVDALGDRDDVIDHVEDLLDAEVETEAFEPEQGLRDRIGVGARRVAYSFGAGVASHLSSDGDVEFRV
ncbi:MAG: S49 family peptidase [Halobaculum sp.]